jgi:hypothetical protein
MQVTLKLEKSVPNASSPFEPARAVVKVVS